MCWSGKELCMRVWGKEQESSDVKIRNRKLVQLPLQMSLVSILYLSGFCGKILIIQKLSILPKRFDEILVFSHETNFCGMR